MAPTWKFIVKEELQNPTLLVLFKDFLHMNRTVRIQYKLLASSGLIDVNGSFDVTLAKISFLDFVLKSSLSENLVGGHYKTD